ncbi:MAG: 1-acyl-sn-glycerol-3-phosphate acyltransferase [Paludibacteraceae bacterium]|nr:1-acyl-sn-glycerol-3-phosphate acyltransferase [Paludibacteraceae bacterium]MBP6284708.1 1-acyl-sn-glycerol-3-phosphate acyltransferase [Paludibacteraceae bacterium]
MKKNISKFILKSFGWKTYATIPDIKKLVVCVAPHTSNWDFIIGKLFYVSMGRKASFLIKQEWLKPPIGKLFIKIGAIGVNRGKKTSLTDQLAKVFEEKEEFHLAVTPEGTRKKVDKWKLGFYQIAKKAGVPIMMVTIDYKLKEVSVLGFYEPTDDMEKDLNTIKSFYENTHAKYPTQFSLGKDYKKP